MPDAALGVLENFVHDGTPITLLPADQLAAVQKERGVASARELPEEQLTELLVERREVHADVTTGGYLPRLRNLAYKAKTVLEETGANNLYLALGSLVWELDGRPLRSPLVLIPVVLTPLGRTGSYRVTLDEAGASTPNYCLLEKLRQLHGLAVPTLTEPADGATLDLDTALEAMRVALVGHGLPYRVESTADLAILQFAKFRLWKDLDEHWSDFADNPLVAHLVHEPTEAFADPARDTGGYVDLDDLAAQLPAAADASQLRAIAEAAAGRTFVLEGPPGTGKSQTITNLLTRAVAEGKRVLFVAEKRAALDVVARRLDAVGMGMFALDLHDKGSRASMVRAQIRLALEHAVAVDEQGLAAAGGGPALGPPPAGPLRRPAARRQRRRAVAVLGAHGGADRRHRRRAAAGAAAVRGQRPGRGADVGAPRARAAARHRRPDPALAAPPVGVRRLPRHRPARHPGRGRRGGRAPCARSSAIPELSGVLRRARTPDELDALAHLLSGPAIGLDVLDETFTEPLDGGDVGACSARSRRSPRSATRASTSATPEALQPAAGRDLRGRADRGGVVLVRAAGAG